jgi:voltage-gated sodium channel
MQSKYTPFEQRHLSYVKLCFKFKNMVLESNLFSNLIIMVILIAGISTGIELYDGLSPPVVKATQIIDESVKIIFIIEMALKIWGEAFRPYLYFADYWNFFDFLIVLSSLLPIPNDFTSLIRMVRMLRVLKLVRVIPQLRILVFGLVNALGSIGYIFALLILLFYVWALMGNIFLGENDPRAFGSLHIGMMTLFRMLTFDNWNTLYYTAVYGCADGASEYNGKVMQILCVLHISMNLIVFSFYLY